MWAVAARLPWPQRHAAVDGRDREAARGAIVSSSSVTCTASSRVGTRMSAVGRASPARVAPRSAAERERLARAGGRLGEDVVAGERGRDDHRLDRKGVSMPRAASSRRPPRSRRARRKTVSLVDRLLCSGRDLLPGGSRSHGTTRAVRAISRRSRRDEAGCCQRGGDKPASRLARRAGVHACAVSETPIRRSVWPLGSRLGGRLLRDAADLVRPRRARARVPRRDAPRRLRAGGARAGRHDDPLLRPRAAATARCASGSRSATASSPAGSRSRPAACRASSSTSPSCSPRGRAACSSRLRRTTGR